MQSIYHLVKTPLIFASS